MPLFILCFRFYNFSINYRILEESYITFSKLRYKNKSFYKFIMFVNKHENNLKLN